MTDFVNKKGVGGNELYNNGISEVIQQSTSRVEYSVEITAIGCVSINK